jgi:hypothetical protein
VESVTSSSSSQSAGLLNANRVILEDSEQKAFSNLWADVAALLKQAETSTEKKLRHEIRTIVISRIIEK